jgi:hypothetical protein
LYKLIIVSLSSWFNIIQFSLSIFLIYLNSNIEYTENINYYKIIIKIKSFYY